MRTARRRYSERDDDDFVVVDVDNIPSDMVIVRGGSSADGKEIAVKMMICVVLMK